MTQILNRLLGKLGAKYEDLNQEERDTFNQWREALAGRRLTDEDVAHFLETEFNESVEKATDPALPEKVREFYQMEVRFIKKVRKFLDTPELEKKLIEQQIKSQL